MDTLEVMKTMAVGIFAALVFVGLYGITLSFFLCSGKKLGTLAYEFIRILVSIVLWMAIFFLAGNCVSWLWNWWV